MEPKTFKKFSRRYHLLLDKVILLLDKQKCYKVRSKEFKELQKEINVHQKQMKFYDEIIYKLYLNPRFRDKQKRKPVTN